MSGSYDECAGFDETMDSFWEVWACYTDALPDTSECIDHKSPQSHWHFKLLLQSMQQLFDLLDLNGISTLLLILHVTVILSIKPYTYSKQAFVLQ